MHYRHCHLAKRVATSIDARHVFTRLHRMVEEHESMGTPSTTYMALEKKKIRRTDKPC